MIFFVAFWPFFIYLSMFLSDVNSIVQSAHVFLPIFSMTFLNHLFRIRFKF